MKKWFISAMTSLTAFVAMSANAATNVAQTATDTAQAAANTAGGPAGTNLLHTIDWIVIAVFFALVIGIGLAAAKSAGKSTDEFFLGGRGMPWWLLGVSMVACTFSCDTPNLVTDLVRNGGVTANWAWWAFLITGMVTVFIYAQLWRRSKVMTDLEFYELRYSGKPAAVLRGFRAIYLGIFFNVLIMGSVTLAAIKIGQIIFNLDPLPTVIFASLGVVVYATAGGIKGCIWADFFQYSIAMFGAVYAAFIAVSQEKVGGLHGLLTHADITSKLSVMPDFSLWLSWVPLLLIPIAVQWWAVWYPGAEPGGGGYIAQRMLSAKNEKNAIGATLFFNFMHYAMRPWPWIIVALASMICFPELSDIQKTFPNIDPTYLKEDIAYPAMISLLKPGFLGLVVASLIAAYMSTIGTHLNWGSSYAVNDFYARFIRKNASQKELVTVGRITTVFLMVLAGTVSLTVLQNAGQAFTFLLLSGAGTGAIYLLRWFWYRVNAWTEIAGMVAASVVALWIIIGPGNDGVKSWIVDFGSVQEFVYSTEDPAILADIKEKQDVAKPKIEALAAEVKKLQKDKAQRHLYQEEYLKLVKLREDNTTMALFESYTNTFNEAKAKITAAIPVKQGEKPKEPKLDILIKGDTIYVFDKRVGDLVFPVQLMICVSVVTLVWLLTTLLTKPSDKKVLREFYKNCHPGGPGWKKVVLEARADGEEIDQKNGITDWKLPIQLLCVFLGCIAIYASLFSVGNFVYGNIATGGIMAAVAAATMVALFKLFGKLGAE
jgi:Na+/proline symporter